MSERHSFQMGHHASRQFLAILVLLAVLLPVVAVADEPAALKVYETRYYTIYTDIDPDGAREADIRMTRMAEEYHNRTRDFAGTVRSRMPFYLYRDPEDYWASGAPRASGGFFDGKQLKAIAGEHPTPRTWHVVQHEGFHQFAEAVMGGHRPMWVDEGLAEYYGEAVFTGDGFVTGVIPPKRLASIQKQLTDGKFLPIERMMNLSREEWNASITIANYDQAWAMTQFLAHGDNGAYQSAFTQFMILLGQGRQWQDAWQMTFGSIDGFEQKWRKYWTDLQPDPTADLYTKATISKLSSLLGRSFAQHKTFADFGAYFKALRDNEITMSDADWLPHSLITSAVAEVEESQKGGGVWTLKPLGNGRRPTVTLKSKDGSAFTGKFTLTAGKVSAVDVQSIAPQSKKN